MIDLNTTTGDVISTLPKQHRHSDRRPAPVRTDHPGGEESPETATRVTLSLTKGAEGRFSKKSWFGKLTMILLLLLTFFGSATAFAQKPGILTGVVTDVATNLPLIGASVSPAGGSGGTVTDADGKYRLVLDPGTYKVTFSFTGYAKKEITSIEIKEDQITSLDIVLEKASKEMEGVVVSSTIKKESQSTLYSLQKRSSSLSDGISAEVIRKTPDNNAAQALKRVTGINVTDNKFVVVRGMADKYNQTTLDGAVMSSTETDKNAFAFDLIPASLIENIVVNKSATPDLPAGFAGGIVQIKTKDFPDKDILSLQVKLGAGDRYYNRDFYSDSANRRDKLGYGYKNRKLPDGFPVGFFGIGPPEKIRALRMLPNNLNPVNYGKIGPGYGAQLGFGKTFRFANNTRFGIIGGFNYSHSKTYTNETGIDGIIYGGPGADTIFSGVFGNDGYIHNNRYQYAVDQSGMVNFSYRVRNNTFTLKNLYTNIFRNTLNFSDDFDNKKESFSTVDSNIVINYFTEQKALFSTTLGGDHIAGKDNKTRIDWSLNGAWLNTKNPDARRITINLKKDWDPAQSTGSYDDSRYFSQGNTTPDLKTILRLGSRAWYAYKDFTFGGTLNITTNLDLFSSTHILKSGISFLNNRRDVTGIIIPLQKAYGNSLSQLYAPDHYDIDRTYTQVSSDLQSGINYISGKSLSTFYESLDSRITKDLRLIWGFRLENYQQKVFVKDGLTFDGFGNGFPISSFYSAINDLNFMPSVNLVYNFVPKMNFRASWSNTVIRPDAKELLYPRTFNFVTLYQEQGDTSLRSTRVRNLDLKLEWFPSAGELLSIGAYHKDLQNPVEYKIDIEEPGLITPFNPDKAIVQGLEAEVRKKLNFIGGLPWLAHVTLFGNGALIKSRVNQVGFDIDTANNLVPVTVERRLSGQPDYILNTGISITAFKESMELTVSYSIAGDVLKYIRPFFIGPGIQAPDGSIKKVSRFPVIMERNRRNLDIVLTQEILKGRGKFKLTGSNLLRPPIMQYYDFNGDGKYTGTFKGTLRGYLFQDKSQNYIVSEPGYDPILYYAPGERNFSFSFTYNF